MADPIKGIIFDKDGTLFEFQSTWAGWMSGFLRNLAVPEETRSQVAEALGFDMERGLFDTDSVMIAGTPDAGIERIMKILPEMSKEDLVNRILTSTAETEQMPAADLPALLDGLRTDGLVLGVATNDAEAPARANLRSAGIEEKFDFIAGYDSGFGPKPEPGMLLAFSDRFDIAPQNIAMVGDSRHDLLAGRRAGMSTVAVLTGTAGEEDLAPLADVVMPSIADLPNWLKTR